MPGTPTTRRTAAGLLAGALLIPALAACSGNDTTANASATGSASASLKDSKNPPPRTPS
ncbi:hypothetical protein [Streptomyces sp. NPDC058412]|uniref:hypothetical protein n=1 Tax=Streptomyces sp. NPDC058412 TaxID=3346486 RepID=UPI003655AB87